MPQAEAVFEDIQHELEKFVESLDSFDSGAHQEAQQRLKTIVQLLHECDCHSIEQLLEAAQDAQAAIDQWAVLAGATLISLAEKRTNGCILKLSCVKTGQ
jgi:hypothetical protein